MVKLRMGKVRKGVLRRAARNLEERYLMRVGRKAVRQKMAKAGVVTRKAVKAGLIAGTVIGATVARRELRKRRQKV